MDKTHRTSIRMLVLSALFTALVAVGAFIRVPVPMWPFTLQTLFATMAALLLGPRYGTLSCAAYTLLGLVGLPIFTGGGGLQYVFQPTFGCIIGFSVGAYIAGTIVQKAPSRGFLWYFVAALIDMIAVYAIGMTWFWCIRRFYLGDPIGGWTLFVTCFVPTIGVDIAKALCAAYLSARLAPIIGSYALKNTVG